MPHKFMVVIVLLLLPVPVLAWAADHPQLAGPNRVAVGEAFSVKVTGGQAPEKVRLTWLDRSVDLKAKKEGSSWQASALLGADVKSVEAGTQTLRVNITTGDRDVELKKDIILYTRKYPEEHLKLPPHLITPPEGAWERIKKELELVNGALATVTPEPLYSLPLESPVPGRVLSNYWLKRYYNGIPSANHRGLDLFAGPGEPIKAAAAGRVILTGDHYFSGNSVYLDHGQGVVTVYFHMSRITVTEGQTVARGETLGLVGSTGRSTGPHLHFGLYLLTQAVDPWPLLAQEKGKAPKNVRK